MWGKTFLPPVPDPIDQSFLKSSRVNFSSQNNTLRLNHNHQWHQSLGPTTGECHFCRSGMAESQLTSCGSNSNITEGIILNHYEFIAMLSDEGLCSKVATALWTYGGKPSLGPTDLERGLACCVCDCRATRGSSSTDSRMSHGRPKFQQKIVKTQRSLALPAHSRHRTEA